MLCAFQIVSTCCDWEVDVIVISVRVNGQLKLFFELQILLWCWFLKWKLRKGNCNCKHFFDSYNLFLLVYVVWKVCTLDLSAISFAFKSVWFLFVYWTLCSTKKRLTFPHYWKSFLFNYSQAAAPLLVFHVYGQLIDVPFLINCVLSDEKHPKSHALPTCQILPDISSPFLLKTKKKSKTPFHFFGSSETFLHDEDMQSWLWPWPSSYK